MAKKQFTTAQIKKITGASRHESFHIPFYYTPPFLDELRDWLKSHLSSRGGRPTIEELDLVRKVRFSQKNWRELELIAKSWSQSGVSVSPSHVATSILEHVISAAAQRKIKNE